MTRRGTPKPGGAIQNAPVALLPVIEFMIAAEAFAFETGLRRELDAAEPLTVALNVIIAESTRAE